LAYKKSTTFFAKNWTLRANIRRASTILCLAPAFWPKFHKKRQKVRLCMVDRGEGFSEESGS